MPRRLAAVGARVGLKQYTATYSWESAELFGFDDEYGPRFGWVRYEITTRRGHPIAERQAVAVRDLESFGPIAEFVTTEG
jgi:hypothetical protein